MGTPWCTLCTHKRKLFNRVGTTPENQDSKRPGVLPKDSYGAPESRRWDVKEDGPTRGLYLGEIMENHIVQHPDPRLAKDYAEISKDLKFPIQLLPQVVVRQLLDYLAPMDVIRLAYLLPNFRKEVKEGRQPFEERWCPCHTQIIGNQCWLHTKDRTNLFRRLTETGRTAGRRNPILTPEEQEQQEQEWEEVSKEQIMIMRQEIDRRRHKRRSGHKQHYGGTESWNRRYDRPKGIHQTVLGGDTPALVEMFPPGTIEDGIIHLTILKTGERVVTNNMGLLFIRMVGANVTLHSIRMKGMLEQPLADGIVDLMDRQEGAACQIRLEGDQQIEEWNKAPIRWCTISGLDGRKLYKTKPIPYLFHKYFVRASLPMLEETGRNWLGDYYHNTGTGEYYPSGWEIVRPYLRMEKDEGDDKENHKKGRRKGDGTPVEEPGCTPLWEREWNGWEFGNNTTLQETSRSIHQEGNVKRKKTISETMVKRTKMIQGAYKEVLEYPTTDHYCFRHHQYCYPLPPSNPLEWRYRHHFDPRDHPSCGQGRTSNELRSIKARRIMAVKMWETARTMAEWGRHEERPAATLEGHYEPPCTNRKELLSEEEESDPEEETTGNQENRHSEGDSETEPDTDMEDRISVGEPGGSSDTEPRSPETRDTEEKGEPNKPIPEVKAEMESEGETDPWYEPWSEPESPNMWEYYMSSDGVTRNYGCITYGPRPEPQETTP